MELVEQTLAVFFQNDNSLAVEETALDDRQTITVNEVFDFDIANLLLLPQLALRDISCNFLQLAAFFRFTLNVAELDGKLFQLQGKSPGCSGGSM